MAIFNITVSATALNYTREEVVGTCSSLYLYNIEATDGQSVTVTLSGDYEYPYYVINGEEKAFVGNSFTENYNKTLMVAFSIPTSGAVGVYNSAVIKVENTVTSEFFTDVAVIDKDYDVNCPGSIIASGTFEAGATITKGDAVYIDSLNRAQLTDASSTAKSVQMIGIANNSAAVGEDVHVITEGRYQTSGLVAESMYYLSETPGQISETPPSGIGTVVRVMGYSTSTTDLFVKPGSNYIVLGQGVFDYSYREISSTTTVLATDNIINVTANTFDLTLYDITSDNNVLIIKNSGTGILTIVPDASDTIDDTSSITLINGESIMIQSDGVSNWVILL